jgi:outer membrane protein assembly factor BamB
MLLDQRKKPVALGVLVLFLASAAPAEEWPGWRGPRGDGVSGEKNVPTKWSSTANVHWKIAIPGLGHSSPIVWADRVFITTCIEEQKQRLLLCLDRHTGKKLWERVVLTAPLEQKHRLNNFASATPAADGKQVYVAFLDYPHMVVVSYDFEGKEVWRKSPGTLLSKHGFCSSPVLYKDLVILNGDQDGDGYLVALDRATGAERWRTARPNHTRSYCTPVIYDAAGKKQLVLSGSRCVASYDPDTGKQHWIIDGPTEQYVASLVMLDGLFFLTAGYPKYHLMAIRPDGRGNVTRSHVAWHHADVGASGASYVPSPIAHDQYLYVVSDSGFLHCLEAKTGKKLWTQRLGRHHSASPVYADGHLYFLGDDGLTLVLKANGKYDVVSQNALEEECYASPAISRGQLFIRTLHHLYCIGEPAR